MYRIIGADGRQYGPITAERLRQWIAEGRANAQTQIFVEGTTEWKPLGVLPEFANYFASQVPPTISPLITGNIPKTNSFAMAGMIFGILSLVCCCKFLFGVLGVIFSLIGLSQINRHPELYEGRGLAIAGLVLSIASWLLVLALLIFALATGHLHFNWNFTGF
jgi:hypothetical protein